MKRQSSISDRSPFRWICALAIPAAILFTTAQLATADTSNDTRSVVTYGFEGTVSGVHPGSTIFRGVDIGTPIQGQFSIDYRAPVQTNILSPNIAYYKSVNTSLRGRIGEHLFSSTPSPFMGVKVSTNITGRTGVGNVSVSVRPELPTNSNVLELGFEGRIADLAIPDSAAAFSAFLSKYLFVQLQNGEFGQYFFVSSITRIQTDTVEIISQPLTTSVQLNSTAELSILARATINQTNTEAIFYQWQIQDSTLNWLDISGANSANYIIPKVESCDLDWSRYRCIVGAGQSSTISEVATLRVFSDCIRPSVTEVSSGLLQNNVLITFSRRMDTNTTADMFNYHLANSDGDILLLGDQLSEIVALDGRTVVLFLPSYFRLEPDTSYQVILGDLRDFGNSDCSCNLIDSASVHFTTPSRECVQITKQPRSRLASPDCPVTFEVSARRTDGSFQPQLRYQWFKNNQAIADATNSTYTSAPIQVADSGATFHAEVGSTCATLVSSNAVITVTTDTIPLNLDSAKPGLAPNSVILSFSSPCGTPDGRLVAHLASNQLNYNWSGDIFSTRAHVDCTGTNVIVFTTPQQSGKTYSVSVQNLADTAGYPLKNGGATATFTAPERTPVPSGILRTTTLGNQTLLEWAADGLLQMADLPSGPWTDVTTANSTYLITPSPFPCTGDSPPPSRYYRVRWGAQ